MVDLVRRPMRQRLEYVVRQQIAHGASADVIVLAVMAALREPTEAMCRAIEGAFLDDKTNREIWQAAIDATLT